MGRRRQHAKLAGWRVVLDIEVLTAYVTNAESKLVREANNGGPSLDTMC